MYSFEEIYDENYEALSRFAVKITGSSDGAKDIMQEVFIDFFNKKNNGYEILNPKTWLYRVTFNKCIDNNRRFRHLKRIGPDNENISDPDISEQQYEKDVIRSALSKLRKTERNLAVLYSEGLSYKEISEATGIRFTSVGKMLARTLKKIRKELKKQGYEMH